MERSYQQSVDEFYITSIAMLRGREHLPPEMVTPHEYRMQHAQDFFDRWGISLEQTLSMPQEEFEYFVGLVVGDAL